MKTEIRILSVLELVDRALVTYATQNTKFGSSVLFGTWCVRTEIYTASRSGGAGTIRRGDSMIVINGIDVNLLPKAIDVAEIDAEGTDDVPEMIEEYLVENCFCR